MPRKFTAERSFVSVLRMLSLENTPTGPLGLNWRQLLFEFVFSGLVTLIRAIIFQPILYTGAGYNIYTDPTSLLLIELFGFTKLSWDNIFYVVPDICVSIISGLLYFKWGKKVLFKDKKRKRKGSDAADETEKDIEDPNSFFPSNTSTFTSRLADVLFLPFVFVLSVCFCSLFGVVYFFVYLGSMVLFLRGNTMQEIVHSWYRGVLYYTIFCMFVIYIFQLPLINEVIMKTSFFGNGSLGIPSDHLNTTGTSSYTMAQLIGLVFWKNMNMGMPSSWLVVIQWTSLVILFLLCSSKHLSVLTIDASEKNQQKKKGATKQNDDDSLTTFKHEYTLVGQNPNSPTPTVAPTTTSFLKYTIYSAMSSSSNSSLSFWLWPVCLFLLLAICVTTPSILGTVLYAGVAIGCFVVDQTSVHVLPSGKFPRNKNPFFTSPSFWHRLVLFYNSVGIPIIALYLVILSAVQYMYNLVPSPFLSECGTWCADVGLSEWPHALSPSSSPSPSPSPSQSRWDVVLFCVHMGLRGLTTFVLCYYSRNLQQRIEYWKSFHENNKNINSFSKKIPQRGKNKEDIQKKEGNKRDYIMIPENSSDDEDNEDHSSDAIPHSDASPKTDTSKKGADTKDQASVPPECTHRALAIWKSVYQFLLEYSSFFSLALLYFSALISANLVSAVYMLFFIVFAVSPKGVSGGERAKLVEGKRRRFGGLWVVLVMYCQLVIGITCLWQGAWAIPIQNQYSTYFREIGLYRASTDRGVISVVVTHLFILLFSSFQWHINRINLEHEEARALKKELRSAAKKTSEENGENAVKKEKNVKGVMKPLEAKQTGEVHMDSHFLKTVFSLVSKEGIGLCVCYAVILLAATFGGQLGTSVPILPQNNTFLSPPSPSPPPSTQVSYALDFVSVGYLFFCYICFFVHVIFPFRAMSIIRVGWSAVVVLSGIMLIGLYVYQFPLVYMWVSQTFQKTLLAKYFSVELFGLRLLLQQPTSSSSIPPFSVSLALGLLGHTLVFVTSVYELRLFYTPKNSKKEEDNSPQKSSGDSSVKENTTETRKPDLVDSILVPDEKSPEKTTAPSADSTAPPTTTALPLVTPQQPEDDDSRYILWCLPRDVIFPLLDNTLGVVIRLILVNHVFLSVICVLGLLMFWDNEGLTPVHVLGLMMIVISNFTHSGLGNMSFFVLCYCWLLIFGCITLAISTLQDLFSVKWRKVLIWLGFGLSIDPFPEPLSSVGSWNSVNNWNNDDVSAIRSRVWGYVLITVIIVFQRYASRYLNSYHRGGYSLPLKPLFYTLPVFHYNSEFEKGNTWDRLKWYLSHFWTIHSWGVLTLVLLLAIYYHQSDVLGLVYSLTLGIFSIALNKRTDGIKSALYGIIVFMILLQCCFTQTVRIPEIFFPQISGMYRYFDSNPLGSYLLLSNQPGVVVWNILVDVSVLLSLVWYMHASSDAGLHQLRQISPTFNRYYHQLVECSYTPEDVAKLSESILNMNWAMLRFSFIQFSPFWILLFVFSVGTLHSEILSLCYLVFSLYLLSNNDYLYKHKNRLWRIVRWINFAFILLRLIYQFPLVHSKIEISALFKEVILPLFGFQVSGHSGGLAEQILGLDLIIFGLLTYQKRLFELKDFDLVMQVKAKERKEALSLALKRYKEYRDSVQEKKEIMKIQAQERQQQLLQLRLRREKRHQRLQRKRHRQSESSDDDSMEVEYDPVQEKEKKSPVASPSGTVSPPPTPMVLSQQTHSVTDESQMLRKRKKEKKARPISQMLPTLQDWTLVTVHPPESPNDKKGDSQDKGEEKEEKIEVLVESVKLMLQRNLLKIVDAFIALLDKYCYENLLDQKTRFARVVYGIHGVVARHSQNLVYLVMIINAIAYNNLLSLLYPLSLFGFALLESPRPSKRYFRFIFLWTMFVICVKFLAQIDVFCPCNFKTSDGFSETMFYSVKPYCGSDVCGPVIYKKPSLLEVIGIEKSSGAFVGVVFYDVLILVALSLNQHMLKKLGLWDLVGFENIEELNDQQQQKDLQAEIKASHDDIQVTREQTKKKLGRRLSKDAKVMKEIYRKKGSQNVAPTSTTSTPKSSPPEVKTSSEEMSDLTVPSVKNIDVEEVEEEVGKDSEGIPNSNNVEAFEPVLDILDLSDNEDEDGELSEKKSENALDPTDPVGVVSDEDSSKSSDSKDDKKEENEDKNEENVSDRITWAKHKLSTLGHRMKLYFQFITSPKKLGVDYYAFIFFIDIISFALLALAPKDFIGEGNNIVQLFSQNRIPTPFVMMLLSQFVLIIVERVIYLYRATKVKLALLYLLILVYHGLFFLLIPIWRSTPFEKLFFITLFYILKILYFIASALQVRDGYPYSISTNRVFQSNMESPGYLDLTLFSLYRAIPFVFELRTLLDWTITPTTLGFYEYFKCEDIFAELYSVKVRIVSEKNAPRQKGDLVPAWNKWLTGGGLFLLFCVVLWIPLILFTQGANSGSSAQPTQVTIKVGIGGFMDFYTSYEVNNIKPAADRFSQLLDYYRLKFPGFGLFNSEDYRGTYVVYMTKYSEETWLATPPSRASLIRSLDPNITKELDIVTGIKFESKSDVSISYKYPKKLNLTERLNFISVLNNTNGNTKTVNLYDLLPRVFRLPSGAGSLSVSSPGPDPPLITVNAMLTLQIEQENFNVSSTEQDSKVLSRVVEYWRLTALNDSDTNSPFNSNTEQSVQIVVVSSPFASWIPQAIAVSGILGLYTVFVLGVGRFLRMYVTGISHRIIYEDMPDVDDLLQYCTDIILAREDGAFELEEELYRELIETYRSPERLIRRTLPKPHTQ